MTFNTRGTLFKTNDPLNFRIANSVLNNNIMSGGIILTISCNTPESSISGEVIIENNHFQMSKYERIKVDQ